MKNNRKLVYIIAGLLLLILGIWAARTYFGVGAATTSFRTVALERGEIIQTVTANGALSAVQTVDVGSEVSGKIVELYADYNSIVTNGQMLAKLDDSSYLRQQEQGEAEVESAKASLKLAEANFRRAKELLDLELISQSDFDQSEATLAQARATLRMREASLDKVMVDIEKTTIFSPMDGVVISRAVDVGQTVAASLNAPTLFTLAQDLRHMRIEAEISEADVGGVEEGQEVTFTVDAYPDRQFTGIVSQVRFEPVTVQNVVNYIAIVEVENADLKLRPGMTANASVVTAKRENALRLPNAVLRFRPPTDVTVEEDSAAARPERPSGPPPEGMGPPPGDGPGFPGDMPPRTAEAAPKSSSSARTVYVTGGKGALKKVRVQTGITDGSWTEVLGGLKPGDEVVSGIMTEQDHARSAAQGANNNNPFMPSGPPRR